MKIEKGDIVETPNGLGTVTDDRDYSELFSTIFGPKCRVKLNDSQTEENFNYDQIKIKFKMPSLTEVNKAADKIVSQLNESSLENRDKDELRTHLGYLKDHIKKNKQLDKKLMLVNFQYIDGTLKAYEDTNSAALSWCKSIKPELEKMRRKVNFS
ncbi:MAG: hypothetical protein WBA07_06610 [Rivularia sp. (in: cyanobacteria)]